MIDISNISVGWATVHIGHCSFNASYLTDIKSDFDYLFNLDNSDYSVRKIVLEGEGHGDLNLIAYLTFENLNEYLTIDETKNENYGDVINIIWQPIFSVNSNSISLLKFPYDKFKAQYQAMTNAIKDNYIKNFICPIDDDEYKEAVENYDKIN
jgi:hypothetical protein